MAETIISDRIKALPSTREDLSGLSNAGSIGARSGSSKVPIDTELADDLWRAASDLESMHGTLDSIDYVIDRLVEEVCSDGSDPRAKGALISMSTMQYGQLRKLNEQVAALYRIARQARELQDAPLRA